MEWTASADKLHPDKPGLRRYEQIPCLIVKNREILLRQWNCEHLVWDTEDGDDFYCKAEDVTHWMPLPDLPPNSKVSRSETPPEESAAGTTSARPASCVAFPSRAMALLREAARDGWEDGEGELLRDDLLNAIAWIEARAQHNDYAQRETTA